MLSIRRSSFVAALGLALSICTFSAENVQARSKTSSAESKTVKESRTKAQVKANKMKKKLHRDAVQAMDQVETALDLLGSGKNKLAMKKLEVALGKIESALASEPKDALLPFDSDIDINQLMTTSEIVREQLKEVKRLLNKHKVQQARKVLNTLTSEVTVRTAYLPLGSFPVLIKQAIKELSENKTDEAKDSLRFAESLIVEEVDVFPIPLLVAQDSLEQARISHKKKREKEAGEFLSFAKDQLKVAQELGYASRHDSDYKKLEKDIGKLRSKLKNGDQSSLFQSVKKKVAQLFSSSQKSEKTHLEEKKIN